MLVPRRSASNGSAPSKILWSCVLPSTTCDHHISNGKDELEFTYRDSVIIALILSMCRKLGTLSQTWSEDSWVWLFNINRGLNAQLVFKLFIKRFCVGRNAMRLGMSAAKIWCRFKAWDSQPMFSGVVIFIFCRMLLSETNAGCSCTGQRNIFSDPSGDEWTHGVDVLADKSTEVWSKTINWY